jgi:glycerophosphoryl diester phosphodiesterase
VCCHNRGVSTFTAHRPQVVAHRGASAEAPEHTLAAYRTALEAGADALECDVRLTADGHLVCVHDRKVNRTSDGRGVVSTLELARLEELDFGSWHPTLVTGRDGVPGLDSSFDGSFGRAGAAVGGVVGVGVGVGLGALDKEGGSLDGVLVEESEEPDRDRNRVLTLRRLLALVVEHSRPVELAIEVKHPTRYAGLVERSLIELLDELGLAHPRSGEHSPVRVMSFSRTAVRRIHKLAPSLDTVFLMEAMSFRLRDGALPRGVGIAGPSIEILRQRPDYVERQHRSGNRVHVWTVDDPDDVELCLKLSVDAIITNRPREVRRLVDG